ncbi:MAG: Gfo/Idh/MocA family oxidoreductase [Gemmataceae bacterium]
MHTPTRRTFLVSAATALPLFTTSAIKAAPSERLNLCIVGVRGRGRGVALGFARLKEACISHVCDVNAPLMAPFAKAVDEVQKTTPKMVQDLRKVLEDPSVDGLIVATPDHWHALATIWGCQAGKHVYVEKPVSHNIFEGRQMVAASRHHKRIVQTGTQSRSVPHMIQAIEYIRSGKLGKIHQAKAWNSQLRRRVAAAKDAPVPAGLDWDIWQGPAPERTFNPNRYSYGWRWLWDYGTGDMGNDGVHDLDIARWGLGVGAPSTVQCTGGKLFFDGDIQETPDTQFVTFTFPESKALLVYEQRLWSPYHQEGHENGVAFYGTEGYLILGRSSWKVVGPRNKVVLEQREKFSDTPHFENFLACAKSGKRPNCDIEDGHLSTQLAHLGNIAYRVGRPLKYDGKAEKIIGDEEANGLLRRTGRKAFQIPEKF